MRRLPEHLVALRRTFEKPDANPVRALIASIAIARDLPLYTVNPEDFRSLEQLQVVEVPHPDEFLPDGA